VENIDLLHFPERNRPSEMLTSIVKIRAGGKSPISSPPLEGKKRSLKRDSSPQQRKRSLEEKIIKLVSLYVSVEVSGKYFYDIKNSDGKNILFPSGQNRQKNSLKECVFVNSALMARHLTCCQKYTQTAILPIRFTVN